MLREEHMDLFSTLDAANKTYTPDASIAAEVEGNVITIDPSIPNWDALIYMTEGATGAGDKINLVMQASNERANNGALVNAVTLMNTAFANSALTQGNVLYKNVLPKGYKHFQFSSINNGAFTAGKIFGTVTPEFN